MTQPLGPWLRELREKKEMSQQDVAQALGVDRRMIQRWEKAPGEKDASEPGGSSLLRLFDALGVHVSPLLNVRPRALNAELAEHNMLLTRLDRKLNRIINAENERTAYFKDFEATRRASEAARRTATERKDAQKKADRMSA